MKLDEIDLTDLDLFVHGDPYQAFSVMRREAPLYWHERQAGRGFWCISTYDLALEVYHNPTVFSSERGMALQMASFDQPTPAMGFGSMMILTDPPRHGKLRQIINRRLTPSAVALFEPHIRRVCAAIIDAVIERGACDFVTDIAGKLPTAVICEMLGVAREHWDLMFLLGNQSIGTDDPEYQQGRSAHETGTQAQTEIFNIFSNLIETRRKNPGDDLVSVYTRATIDGEPLTDMEILLNCFLLIIGGQETTRNATSGGLLALIQNPGERARLRANSRMLEVAIEEILRWTSPITHIMRTAKTDIALGGKKISAGDRVTIWNPSANRDERVFADPDRFDIGRAPNDHIAFGHGEHFCIGANLARLELRIMMGEVLRRMPDVELAGPIERLRSNLVAGIKHMPVRFAPAQSLSAGTAPA